ncbi:MAG: DUF2226 domain-containing protein [Syntrophorhabdales bacterium]|jgi:hypothetical protein
MLYPKGEIVHQNLSADYTDVRRLLSTLKAGGFAGVVVVEAADRKGAFFLSSGRVIDAAVGEEANPAAVVGEEAADELFALSEQAETMLHVYRLTERDVEFSAGKLRSEVLFTGLSTDFVRMDRFLQKLAVDKETGFIEIFTKNNQPLGVLFLKDGQEAALQVISERGTSSFFEQKAVPALMQEVMRQGAVFNVYRSLPAAPMKETGTADVDVAACRSADVDVAAGRTTDVDVAASRSADVDVAAGRTADRKVQAEEATPAGRVVTLAEKQKGGATADVRTEFVTALSKVFGKIQRFADGLARKGGFERAFKRACVEKSDLYPFLDPFEGLFEYNGMKIRLDEEVETEDFAVGVAECLNLSLSYLRKELPKNAALPPALKGEIESCFTHYHDVIKRSGLQSVVPATLR